ncbi:MAG: YdeI/OmpD-associated family protein [Arenimonas sp.]
MKPTFFKKPSDFKAWLAKHHQTDKELLVGFYKKDSGKPCITWPESVDEALCYGWIDGVRRSIDEISYTIRFSPRRSTSIWSAVNIKRVEVLTAEGRMQAAGIEAFGARKENKSGIYAYEQRPAELPEEFARIFRKNKAAWAFFQAQPPYYRKTLTWWIVSAKQEATQKKRLDKLIEASAQSLRLL